MDKVGAPGPGALPRRDEDEDEAQEESAKPKAGGKPGPPDTGQSMGAPRWGQGGGGLLSVMVVGAGEAGRHSQKSFRWGSVAGTQPLLPGAE